MCRVLCVRYECNDKRVPRIVSVRPRARRRGTYNQHGERLAMLRGSSSCTGFVLTKTEEGKVETTNHIERGTISLSVLLHREMQNRGKPLSNDQYLRTQD